jgi:hypothetical protein
MATDTGELVQQIEERARELERVQKQLKKPSTIPFAERQSLSNRAGRALADLKARQAEVSAEGATDEQVQAAREALTEAEGVLGRIAAAQPSRLNTGSTKVETRPGSQRQGAPGGAAGRPNAAGRGE